MQQLGVSVLEFGLYPNMSHPVPGSATTHSSPPVPGDPPHTFLADFHLVDGRGSPTTGTEWRPVC